MLLRHKDLVGYHLKASDGAIGTIDDLLFDDQNWAIRWIVADTGGWLPGRKVLLPPESFTEAHPVGREMAFDLTRKHIEDSPGLEADQPVSRQMEARLYEHYAHPPYWDHVFASPAAGAVATVPLTAGGITRRDDPMSAREKAGNPADEAPQDIPAKDGDPHLRSANEVIGYYIQATDEDIGHVEDMFVETGSWKARYLMIDTRNWWPGRMVLISPDWTSDVNWDERLVSVNMTRDKISNSPEYSPDMPLDRAYEARLYDFFGFPRYWQA
jgi:hypothetical protein